MRRVSCWRNPKQVFPQSLFPHSHVAMCEMKIGSWVQVHSHIHPRRSGADVKKTLESISERAGLFWSHTSTGGADYRQRAPRLPKCTDRNSDCFWFQSLNVQCSFAAHLRTCNEKRSAAWLLFALRTQQLFRECSLATLHSYTNVARRE